MLSQDAQILVGDERLLLAQDYDKSLMHLGYDMNLQTHQEQQVVQQQQQQQDICEQATGLDGIVYTNLQNVQSVSNASGHTKKKRKHSQENIVKNEPGMIIITKILFEVMLGYVWVLQVMFLQNIVLQDR